MMKSKKLIVALSMAVLAWPAGAASVAKTYSYFSIGGSTLEQIQQELDVRGPKVKTTGRRHPGATQMEFTSKVGYAESDGGCAVARASVTVKAKIILPRWTRPGRADQDVRLVWDTLSSDIKRHEESHVVIAKNHARQLEQALLATGKQRDCAAAQAKVKQVTQKILARHDRAQVEFDRVEGINFERRIIRLLRYRMERIAAGQSPG
jgi:predicted secreted Zn-dependent protease